MAITTYSSLKTSIANYLNREDLTSVIPDFISLTEAKLSRRYKDVTPLSDLNTSNWLLAAHPDVYLYGALVEASPYLMEDERTSIWAQLYAAAISTLKGAVGGADFNDYDGLKLAIGDWIGRADIDYAIPQLITLAEAQINRDIRHHEMEQRSEATLSGRFLARPGDWLETIRLSIASNGAKVLNLASAATIADKRAGVDDATGVPQLYAHVDGGFEVYPTPDGSYEATLLYTKKIPALSASNISNWLLASNPDVYLYGALVHAAPYLGDDQRAATWAQLYSAAVQRVNQTSDDSTWSGTGLTLKVRGLG